MSEQEKPRFDESLLEISDERLEELMSRYSACAMRGNDLYFLKPCDPRNIAFMWSPEYGEKVKNYRVLTVTKTMHSFGAPALFKPTIAEVLAQAAKAIDPFANGFYLSGDIEFTQGGGGHLVDCYWIRIEDVR